MKNEANSECFPSLCRNPNCVRQLSADSIVPSHTASEANTPMSPSSSGSHLSPIAQKPISDITPSRTQPPVSNRNSINTQQQSPQQQQPQTQSQQQTQPPQQEQKQVGNLVNDINLLFLDNNSQQKTSQNDQNSTHFQQLRPNPTPTTQTNGNKSITNNSTPIISNSVNSTRQSTTTVANGVQNNSQNTNNSSNTETPTTTRTIPEPEPVINSTPRAIDVHQRPRRSTRNVDDASNRRSSRSSRQSTSNAQAVNLVRSGAQYARPTLNLPPGYGKRFF